MLTVLLIAAAIVLGVLYLIGYLLHEFFGAAGIIIPILIIGFFIYIISSIGLDNILIVIAVIAVIRKIVSVIDDIRWKKRLRHIDVYRRNNEPYKELRACDLPGYRVNNNASRQPWTQSDLRSGSQVHNPPKEAKKTRTNNCPNCGALMVDGVCPYCNTKLI